MVPSMFLAWTWVRPFVSVPVAMPKVVARRSDVLLFGIEALFKKWSLVEIRCLSGNLTSTRWVDTIADPGILKSPIQYELSR